MAAKAALTDRQHGTCKSHGAIFEHTSEPQERATDDEEIGNYCNSCAGFTATALATSVGNARLTVHSPKHVGKYWVGSASLVAPKAEALQLQVCIQSNGKTVKSSCKYVHGHKAALAATTKKTTASAVRTWAWVDVAGHTITARS